MGGFKKIKIVTGIIFCSLTAGQVSAQFTYPGCAAVTQADFTTTALITNATDNTLQEPLKMALFTNPQGNVDVYFVQRYGLVRKYDGTAKTVSNLANLNYGAQITAGLSEGLHGIALDPAFATNGWIYLYTAVKFSWAVTRYTLKGATLDMTTAKPIWQVTTTAYSQHMGGAIRFDSDGNLWIEVADNGGVTNPTAAVDTNLYEAANTNSYFGKILRIKPRSFDDTQTPTPGLGSTYDVPTGNLFPQGTAKTLPEIYTMGNRNPYTIAFDPIRKAMNWGEVGPDNFPGATDTNQWTEEHNFTTKPGFFGWPYWAGNQTNLPTQPLPAGSTPAAPINNRPDNTGLTNLPPAIAPIEHYVKSCAITGPVYYYDGSLNSSIKFPPHFNGAWFIGDFDNSYIDAVLLNTAGTAITNRMHVVTSASSATKLEATDSFLEMQMGSDGALYVMNYSGYRSYDTKTGLLRVEYHGSCQPSALSPEMRSLKPSVDFNGALLNLNRPGAYAVEVRNLSCRLEWTRQGEGSVTYDLREIQSPGIHLLMVNTTEGRTALKFMR